MINSRVIKLGNLLFYIGSFEGKGLNSIITLGIIFIYFS